MPVVLVFAGTHQHLTCPMSTGWAEFGNGDLLLEAEAQFNALVTTDQNLRYQQNLRTGGSRFSFYVREPAETRTTQVEDCGCDQGSAAWRLPRFDAALIVFRWSPPLSHALVFQSLRFNSAQILPPTSPQASHPLFSDSTRKMEYALRIHQLLRTYRVECPAASRNRFARTM